MPEWESITADREALRDHIAQACASVSGSRAVTVEAGIIDNFYQGPFPLVEVLFDFQPIHLLGVTEGSDMGQTLANPGRFLLRIRSATDGTAGIDANAAEAELYAVQAAIVKWFAVKANRTLPDAGGAPRASHVGPPFVWRGSGANGPYTMADGSLGQVLAGQISFVGLGLEST